MKLYKLQHTPTGLYFTPSKGNGNLSKNGKIYIDRLPKKEWTNTITIRIWSYSGKLSKQNKLIIEHFNLTKADTPYISINTYVKTNPEDWEIIEITE